MRRLGCVATLLFALLALPMTLLCPAVSNAQGADTGVEPAVTQGDETKGDENKDQEEEPKLAPVGEDPYAPEQGGKVDELVKEITDNMGVIEKLLNERKTGAEAQQHSDTVVKKIEELITELNKT